jgi:hypothetical protein
MYSLFDTLTAMRHKKSIENNPEYAYIKYILMHHDINVMTLTKKAFFDFDIWRCTDNNDNCLTMACWQNTNLPVIKYLIEECKMDVNHINRDNDNCLALACWKNNNLTVIKYLIEDCKMDINRVTGDNNNCLILACLNNNFAIIKYLIEDRKMDINHINKYNSTCLMAACSQNTNLNVIKYLIEEYKMDIKHVNKYNSNCLTVACINNTNLAVIKYLIEDCKMNINHVDQYNNNCLTLVCQENTNLEIIKYLIEDRKMDINHVDQYNNNCLTSACRKNTNLTVIKYLAEDCKMNIEKISHISYDKFKNIVLTISKKYRNLNNLLLMGYKEYENDEMKNLIALINPLQLSNTVINLAGIKNPYDYKFIKFRKLVDELLYGSDLSEKQIKVDEEKNMNMNEQNINEQEILFVHNKKIYYGNRRKVYGSIQVLNDLLDQYNMIDYIVLEGSLPCYAINQYIEACNGSLFKLKNIHEDDFIIFLKFIDQYPSVQISIRGIEDQIIQYVTKYNATKEVYFKTIYERYDLKKLYLHMHNLKLKH